MPGEEIDRRCAVILTAIPVEYQAVRAHLSDIHTETHEKGNIYERGTFLAGNHTWEVGIVEVGAGNVFTAVQTERAISHFKPLLILFVGVAGGLKDVVLGDVVVATKVYGYESGNANITFQTRPEVGNAPYHMVELARSEARATNWLSRLKKQIPNPPPRVWVAPIAAGGSVVTSTRSAVWQHLKENYNDAIAVEMEGYGFFQAVHANPKVDALIIRGISDRIDDKDETDATNFQEIAAQHASAFAFEILAKLDTSQHLHHVPVVNISSGAQQEGDQKDQENLLQETLKTLLPDKNISNSFNSFYNALPDHHNEIEKAFSSFDSGKDIYEDQCDNAIKELNAIFQYLNTVDRNLHNFDLAILYDLDNLLSSIDNLKLQLNNFRALCPPRTTSSGRKHYTSELGKIRNEKNNFLKKLENFKIQLNRGIDLE